MCMVQAPRREISAYRTSVGVLTCSILSWLILPNSTFKSLPIFSLLPAKYFFYRTMLHYLLLLLVLFVSLQWVILLPSLISRDPGIFASSGWEQTALACWLNLKFSSHVPPTMLKLLSQKQTLRNSVQYVRERTNICTIQWNLALDKLGYVYVCFDYYRFWCLNSDSIWSYPFIFNIFHVSSVLISYTLSSTRT